MAFHVRPKSAVTIDASDVRGHFFVLRAQRDRVHEGFDISTSGSSLDVTVNDGRAIVTDDTGKSTEIGQGEGNANTEAVTVAPNDTSWIWLKNDGTIEDNTTGTEPTDGSGNGIAMLIWKVTTDGSGVTSTSDERDFAVGSSPTDDDGNEVPLKAHSFTADGADAHFIGDRVELSKPRPQIKLTDTNDSTTTVLVARDGKLQVRDSSESGTILTDDLRNVSNPVDVTSTDTTKDKTVSNNLAKGWEDHTNASAPHSGHVQVSGDTMTGNLDFGGTSKVTGLSQATASGEAVHAGRTINTGAGLSGGQNLTSDPTLTWDGVSVELGGTAKGTQRTLNFINGTDVSLGIADDSTNDEVDITVNHADTSSQADVDLTNTDVIDTVTFDGRGHVTGVTSRNIKNDFIDKQVFAADGTWSKPSNADYVYVEVIGAGGGGGGGEKGIEGGTAQDGGLGGGGAAFRSAVFRVSELASNISVTVGSGGTAGSGGVVGGSSATAGGDGGHSSFGSLLRANGGKGGGTATGSAGSGASQGLDSDGASGGGNNAAGGSAWVGLPGGGAGGDGGDSNGSSGTDGKAGGQRESGTAGGGASGGSGGGTETNGSGGSDGADDDYLPTGAGGGGGGGGSDDTSNPGGDGGVGGTGGAPGCGGAGGGAGGSSPTDGTPGSGGDGGPGGRGEVRVYAW